LYGFLYGHHAIQEKKRKKRKAILGLTTPLCTHVKCVVLFYLRVTLVILLCINKYNYQNNLVWSLKDIYIMVKKSSYPRDKIKNKIIKKKNNNYYE
jgi:hypothetical protein